MNTEEDLYDNIKSQDQDLIDEFENYLIAKDYSKKTVNHYVRDAYSFLEYVIEGTDTKECPVDHIQAITEISWYLNRLIYKFQESSYSVKDQARAIKKFYSWLCDEGKISNEQLEKVKEQIKSILM